jgi:DNA (cytosine-5)-methyltransferase 1
MKILNLYCGIGGNRKLWTNCDVTAVEFDENIAKIYKDFFPNDEVIVADAHQYLLDHYKEFDFIWDSPPCPSHSKVRFGLGVCSGKCKAVYPDMRLYQEIILLDKHFKGKYCVENVMAYYKPLIEPKMIGRHWYWSNFDIPSIKVNPSHISQQSKKYSKSPVRIFKISDYEKLYGFDLSKYSGVDKRLLLRNCVEPEIGLHIIQQLNNI